MGVPDTEILAGLVFEQFNLLPKTGKPAANEWTILSAILLHNATEEKTNVVTIGCGTKCIGKSKLCNSGLILNDSHAEILARRAFLRYIYHHLKKALQSNLVNDDCIFEWNAENVAFRLRPNLSFHFLSTQTPCGDACILDEKQVSTVALHRNEDDDGAAVAKQRKVYYENAHKTSNFADNVGSTLDSSVGSLVYTGAKLIGLGVQQDAMQQNIGAMRTKPGRGDRTLSMSCSDKLARWNVLGVQGALLDALLVEPIYFKSLNFCGIPQNELAIRRAICGRFVDREFHTSRFKIQNPDINFAEAVIFDYAANINRQNPSPTGLSWCSIDQNLRPYEISVNGKRQGVTRKKVNTPQAALKISKYHLINEFVALLRIEPKLIKKFQIDPNKLAEMKYNQYKQLAKEYQRAWTLAKQEYFQQWTQKPASLLEFCLMAEKT
ncbi:tRNA-specific adenosine deaminase 1 isoform X1 [Rhagoletis pomonella]|uniref:tRNA-specific adenosine deaminase 1 isoform X1 n=1 Tax=Rhagoletis pomonella TaxID=28610 RepID=UPI00177D9632|nr:tRNA-specific adenosine deaminase 1 isoform X1 [Rhagoletis pomonella]